MKRGRIKIKFDADTLSQFFKQSSKAFMVTRGLPESAELVDIVFDARGKTGVAIFEHDFFSLTGNEDYKIEYTVFGMETGAHAVLS